ncbi:MAG: tetratricopeptide repeat protein [bacterium]|nr:tetratricopeptide repeat protein [bacterium]
MNNRRAIIPALVVVLTVTAVSFFPALNNGFTNWDDPAFITENPDIRELSLQNTGKFFTRSYGGFAGYVPLVMLSYTLEHALFGMDPGAFHRTNLLLHLVVCLLVFRFIYLLARKWQAAFMVSLLFGVHPLHVEAVAWIQGRKDLLFALFYLAALIAYTRYLEKGGKKSLYALALVFFVFALLSKVAAISLPFALLLLDWRRHPQNKINLCNLRNKIPFFLMAVLFVLFAFLSMESGAISTGGGSVDNLGNILLFFYSFVFYIGKVFLPVGLSARYPIEISQLAPVYLLVLSIVIFIAVAVLLYRFSLVKDKKRDVTFGVLFFLVTLMPTIPFHFLKQPYADRYMYLPVIGIFYPVVLFLWHLYHERFRESAKKQLVRVTLVTVIAVVTLSLGYGSWKKCSAWQDGLTLWNDVLSTHPKLSVAYLNRGQIYLHMGKAEAAMADFDKAVAFNPGNAHAYNNRGILYFRRKQYRRALVDYTNALRIDPGYYNAYLNRGNLWGTLGRFREAVSDYDRALALKPGSLVALYYRGLTHRNLGNVDLAERDFKAAIGVNPGYLASYRELLKIYKSQSRHQEAKEIEEKIKIRSQRM